MGDAGGEDLERPRPEARNEVDGVGNSIVTARAEVLRSVFGLNRP